MPLMNIVVLFAIVGSMLAAGILVIIIVVSRQKRDEQVTLPNVDLEEPNTQLLQEDK
jgi:UTP-glucose-1-phosphate uridylyltransferase